VEPTATDGDGPQSITYRNFNEIDLEVFRRDISLSPIGNETSWSGTSLDEVVETYNSSLKQLMDKHAPLNTKKIKNKDSPWMDEELRDLRRKRRAAERAWRKGKEPPINYTSLRTQFKILEKKKRCIYHNKSLKASAGDVKSLYKKVNRLLGNVSHDLPSHQDSGKLAESFGDFFVKKVEDIYRLK
jgi:hypothetical protein